MATWTGEAWLGSASGRQKVSVESNTFHGAKQQIEQIYGATDVHNLREVNDNEDGGSDSDWGDIGFKFALLGIAIIIWLILPVIPYIIVFGALGLIGWGVYKLVKWILK